MSHRNDRVFVIALALICLSWSPFGHAQTQPSAPADATPEADAAGSHPKVVTPQAVFRQQTELRDQLLVGEGRFRAMSGTQRNQIAKRQRQVIEMVRNLNSFDDLRPDQRTELFNDLQWLNEQIAGKDTGRQVCEYGRVVGTHIDHSVCMNAERAEELRRQTRADLNRATMGSGARAQPEVE